MWIYRLYKFRFTYTTDKELMVVFIDINKPDRYLTADERQPLETFIASLQAKGYDVIVRD